MLSSLLLLVFLPLILTPDSCILILLHFRITPMHYRVIMAAECGREATGADVGTLHQGSSIKYVRALAASP
jgi:hypothetical protein